MLNSETPPPQPKTEVAQNSNHLESELPRPKIEMRQGNPEDSADYQKVCSLDSNQESYDVDSGVDGRGYTNEGIPDPDEEHPIDGVKVWMTDQPTRRLRIGEYQETSGKTQVLGIYVYDDDAVDPEQKKRSDQFRLLNNLPVDFPVWEMNILRSSDEDINSEIEAEAVKQVLSELPQPCAIICFVDADDVMESLQKSEAEQGNLIDESSLQKMPNARKAKKALQSHQTISSLNQAGFSYETRIFYLTDPEIHSPDFVFAYKPKQV